MKKRIITLLIMAMAVIMALTACGEAAEEEGSSGSKKEKAAEEETKDEETKEVKLVKTGYSVNEDSYMTFGFVIKNPDKKAAYEFPKITITAYDANGDVLATEEQMMNKIQPGEKQAFGSVMDCNGQKPDKVEFTVKSGNKISASDDAIKSSDLEISGTNERLGEFGDLAVTGKIKNNSSSDTNSVGVTVLFKKGKKIVYASTTYVDDLAAGKEKPFEFSEYDVPEHDSYEVSGVDWGF